MQPTRRLLTRLREMMATGAAPLADVVRLVAGEMVAEVCSIYALRPGDVLELTATFGLRPDAVGRTRLRMGEGIVGITAATGQILNLPDAQMHPAFAYRPETGEEPFASLLAVPVRRAGQTMGVVVVQNRSSRRYGLDEVDAMETVAMLLAEALASAGAASVYDDAVGATLPRQFDVSPLAPGLVVGPVIAAGLSAGPKRFIAQDPAEEQARLDHALVAMRRDLDHLIERGLPAGDESREVLEATRLVAADDGWVKRVSDAVSSGLTAEAAVVRVASDLRDRMRRITDPYLRERLADLEDLAARLLQALDGRTAPGPVAPHSILVVRRLGPAQLLQWHASGIAGVAIEEGSPSGHAAILARALGIPAVGGVRGLIDALRTGDEAVLDADEGQIILRPDAEVRDNYCRAIEARAARRAGFGKLRTLPNRTADGTAFSLMLNVGLALELEQLDAVGASGIGLFRTEIAMLARGSVADTAEQAALYSRVLDAAGDRPVNFRTLDLGGDKLLPDLAPAEEENPAMGWRSLRVALDRPALLRRQLRALLLAAAGRPLSVMFPMVATIAEFRAARGLLYAEAARVRPAPSTLRIGTMLEVPALLWQLPQLLKDLPIHLDRLQRPDAVPVRRRPREPGAGRPLRPVVAARVGHPGPYPALQCHCRNRRLGVRRSGVASARSADVRGPGHHDAVDAGIRPARDESAVAVGRPGRVPLGAGRPAGERDGGGEPARTDRGLGAGARAGRVAARPHDRPASPRIGKTGRERYMGVSQGPAGPNGGLLAVTIAADVVLASRLAAVAMMSYVDPEGVPPPVGAARVGAELRAARQRIGWALPDVANGLRIKLAYLEAIEDGRLSELPGNAYAVGFLRTYATSLGLDADEVARRFRAETHDMNKRTELTFPAPVPQRGVPAGAVVLLGLLIAAGAYVGWYRYTGSGDDRSVMQAATPPPDRLAALVPAPQVQSPQVASILPSSPPPMQATAPSPVVLPAVPVPTPVPVAIAPPAPVAPPAPINTRVVLHAKAGGWVQVRERQGQVLLNRVLRAGETWPIPMRAQLLLTTSNAAAMEVLVDGVAAPSLGTGFKRDVSLDPDMAKAGRTNAPG